MAFAQGPADSGGLDTVVVTAQKQPYRGDTPLKELPQSVQVLSADLLADVGVTDFENALDFASGVARQNSFGGLWDSFAIRGFAGDENVPSGYLVNGFNAGRGFSGRRDASNIQSIEVLKGPGSALYGRSEPGGTINLVTKKPQFDSEGSLELAVGRFDTYRVAGDFTAPIGDSFAFRVNGAYEEGDSFRDTVSSEKYAFTPSFLVRLSDATTVSYELEVVNQEAPFDRGIVALGGVLGTVPNSRFVGEPNDGPMKIEAIGHQAVFQHQFGNGWGVLAGAGYRDSSFKGFSSDAELAQGRQTLNRDGSTLLSRQRRYRDYSATDLSGRLELTGSFNTGSVVHHVLFGADAYEFELDQVQNRFRPTLDNPYGIDVLNPVYGQVQPTPLPFVSTLEEQSAYGVYVQDQIDLTERWKMLAGVRFDDFSQDLTNRFTGSTTSQTPTATSPRVGLVFEASSMVSLYASYSKGFRPNSGSDAAGIAFEPEESKSYEVGVKLETPGGGLNGTVAIYQAEKSNILTSDPINAGFSAAAGEAESKGLEIDVAGQLTDTLRATLSYAYTDAEVTKAALDPNFGNLLPVGSSLLNIPEHSGNLLLMQEFAIKNAVLSLGAGVTYVGERLGETGVPDFQLPDYTLVRLVASYAPTDQLKFAVDVDNLFDETYYPSSYAQLWVGAGSPRVYTFRTVYEF
jgi:iron complex outermembrane receptor protein